MAFIFHLSRVLAVVLGVGLGLAIIFLASAAAGIPIGVILGGHGARARRGVAHPLDAARFGNLSEV